MLSVGIRDGRKGLVFGVGGRMEEAEPEGGDASCYDKEMTLDPDADLSSLSYIDEKLQHVLGHFQKDFEGGVSRESLGAKFGGYGSFLPTYQRSPIDLSHPQNPKKIQTYSVPKSPVDLPGEGGQNPGNLLNMSDLASHASLSSNLDFKTNMPHLVSSSENGVISIFNDGNDMNVGANDQKMLKLRIKVGSSSAPNKKNAAIYCGLGLASPSSPDDSPSVSEGLSSDFHPPDEFPVTLLETMTSCVIPGGHLVSPLPDYLLHITEKENCLLKVSKSETIKKCSQAMPAALANEPLPVKDVNTLGEKKTKFIEKSGKPVADHNAKGKNYGNGISQHLQKENGFENPKERGLVSSTEELSVLSCSKAVTGELGRPFHVDSVKGSQKAFDLCWGVDNGDVKDQNFSLDLVKEKVHESSAGVETCKISNSSNGSVLVKQKINAKLSSENNVFEEKRKSEGVMLDRPKIDQNNVEKNFNICKIDSDKLKGKTDHINTCEAPPERKSAEKVINAKQNAETTSQEAKRKINGNKHNGKPVEFDNGCMKAISFGAPEDKSIKSEGTPFGNRSDFTKSRKESIKTTSKECCRDSLVETKVIQAGNRIGSLELSHKNKINDTKFDSERESYSFFEKSKDKSRSKSSGNLSIPEVNVTLSAAPARLNASEQTADSVFAPTLIKENWVCCDECHKWRLIPYERNPELFLGKWRCSMLDWLPGLNNCTISEEETTRALNERYHGSVLDGQNSAHGQYEGIALGKISADVHHPDQIQEPSLAICSTVSKKHGTKDKSNAFGNDNPTKLSNIVKMKQQSSSRDESANHSFQKSKLANKVSFPDASKSNDLSTEGIQKKRKKALESFSTEGDYIHKKSKHSKFEGKRLIDPASDLTTKKIKKVVLHGDYEDHQLGNETVEEFPNSSNGVSMKVSVKDHGSLKRTAMENSVSSRKKPKDQPQVPLDDEYKIQPMVRNSGESDGTDFSTKRKKLKERRQSQGYPESLQTDGPMSAKDVTRSELQRNKKVRSSESEEIKYNACKKDGRMDKKGRMTKIALSCSRDSLVHGMEEESRGGNINQGNLVSLRARDSIDSVKREAVRAAQTSITANSSSSEVSGSHKGKGNFPELKYSPVESVSSSPLRGVNAVKTTAIATRNIAEKDNMTDPCFPPVVGSPRRYSDFEFEGRGDASRAAKKRKSNQMSRDEFKYRHKSNLPSEFDNIDALNVGCNSAGQLKMRLNKEDNKDPEIMIQNSNDYLQIKRCRDGKLVKGSSLLSGDNFLEDNVKVSDCCTTEQEELHVHKTAAPTNGYQNGDDFYSRDSFPHQINEEDGNYSIHKMRGVTLDDNKNNQPEKVPTIRQPGEGQGGSHSDSSYIHEGLNHRGLKSDVLHIKDGKSDPKKSHSQKMSRDNERSLDSFQLDQTDRRDDFPVNASVGGAMKMPKQPNGAQHGMSRKPTPNGFVGRVVGPSSKDRIQAAAKVLKEAKDLKHSANRLKKGDGELESTNLYFQAALKFLHGASLQELASSESVQNGETTFSMKYYSDTARLCMFCAHEYEKYKEMAAAALAYKCVEVAYLRVIYSRHPCASRDHYRLQKVLEIVPSGESTSSSASDLDDLIKHSTLDKVASGKACSTSQTHRNHVIPASSRGQYERMLSYVQDINSAIEASRKSQDAFAAVNASLKDAKYRPEDISSVKSALDFSFHDVEGLVHLVRLAMEAISC